MTITKTMTAIETLAFVCEFYDRIVDEEYKLELDGLIHFIKTKEKLPTAGDEFELYQDILTKTIIKEPKGRRVPYIN